MQEVQLPRICLHVNMAAPTEKGRYRAGRSPVRLLEILSSEAKLLGTKSAGTTKRHGAI